ncbi:hypothetical protein Ciccas_012944 [Cichlidogyrus casuarinus]|uniref:UspA domain-containing protein n=1 Tax=Cichlidogyrus casuarinus TaxID=1844966 RepID=A0ABD2PMG7_9PLAT
MYPYQTRRIRSQLAGLSREARHVVLPIDSSQNSVRAFEWYLNEMSKPNDLVHFVHVVEPKITDMTYASPTEAMTHTVMRQYEKDYAQGNALGDDFLARLNSHGLRGKFTIHFGNKPGEYIVNLVKNQQVDMVVMGSRGVGKLTRTIFGSVSDYVLHHSHKPVTIIPPI